MKITLKSLKQVPYEVEIQSEDILIKDLKKEIEKKHGFDSECIKILFKGFMLNDEKLIKDYKITEEDTLTMMNPKVKPQNLNLIQENKINEESKENTKNNKTDDKNNIDSIKRKNEENKDNNSKQKNTQSLVTNLVNSLTHRNEAISKSPEKDYNNEIKQLTEMGFNELESGKAIKAAKGNVERAIEYLYNGIPENNIGNHPNLGIPLLEEFYDPEEEEGEEGDYQGAEIPLTFEVDPHMLDQLDLKDPNSLKTIASFVKVLISEDPSSLQNLLEDIEETNPEIIEYIKEHENEFKQLISAPLEDKDLEKLLPISNNPNLNLGQGVTEQINNNQENLNVDDECEEDSEMVVNENLNENNDISLLKQNLTYSEKESVERLKSLGFSEEEVFQAFIACDKNEMLSANFLLENKFKDHHSMDVDGK